jgi:hypothetical protein
MLCDYNEASQENDDQNGVNHSPILIQMFSPYKQKKIDFSRRTLVSTKIIFWNFDLKLSPHKALNYTSLQCRIQEGGQMPKAPEKFSHQMFENAKVCPRLRSSMSLSKVPILQRSTRRSWQLYMNLLHQITRALPPSAVYG